MINRSGIDTGFYPDLQMRVFNRIYRCRHLTGFTDAGINRIYRCGYQPDL